MNIFRFWISFYTLFRREVVRILRIWSQTLVPPIITASLYFAIFGKMIGARIGDMQGVSYIQYIVPGLVMMAIINNSYANVSSSFFGSKFQKNIEEMLVAPMPVNNIIWGYVCGGICRGIVVGILVLIVSLLFSHLKIASIFYTLTIAILTAILFSLAGLLNGIFAQKFDDVAIIPMFILAPLTYLGGVFYSVDLLPYFWQKLTYANPIFYMVNGFRYGMLGQADIDINIAITVITGFVLCFYILSVKLLEKGVGIRS